MTSRRLAALVQRLVADASLRATFVATPDEVLAEEPVSPEERRALLRLRTRLVMAGHEAAVPAGPEIAWP